MKIPSYARKVEIAEGAESHLRSARCSRKKDAGLVWDLVLEWEIDATQASAVMLPEPIAALRPAMLIAFQGGGGSVYRRNLDVEGTATFAWLEDGEIINWQRDAVKATARWIAIKCSEKRALVQQCVRVVGRLGQHIEDVLDSTFLVGFVPSQGELALAPKVAETLPPEPEDTEDESESESEESGVVNFNAPGARPRRGRK